MILDNLVYLLINGNLINNRNRRLEMKDVVKMLEENRLDELKSQIEDVVAKKVAKKITDKKNEFIEKMRASKK